MLCMVRTIVRSMKASLSFFFCAERRKNQRVPTVQLRYRQSVVGLLSMYVPKNAMHYCPHPADGN